MSRPLDVDGVMVDSRPAPTDMSTVPRIIKGA